LAAIDTVLGELSSGEKKPGKDETKGD
jgi:hypothetical protein